MMVEYRVYSQVKVARAAYELVRSNVRYGELIDELVTSDVIPDVPEGWIGPIPPHVPDHQNPIPEPPAPAPVNVPSEGEESSGDEDPSEGSVNDVNSATA